MREQKAPTAYLQLIIMLSQTKEQHKHDVKITDKRTDVQL